MTTATQDATDIEHIEVEQSPPSKKRIFRHWQDRFVFTPPPRPDKTRTILTFIILGTVSFLMRLIKIGFNDDGTPVFDEKHYSVQGMQLLLNGGTENNPGFGLVVHPPLGKALIAFGEAIFGYTPLGWRFSAILAGVTIVMLLCWMVYHLSSSLLLVIATGVIANTEGVLFIMSRMGMLDIFQALFITLIAVCLMHYMTADYTHTRWSNRWWMLGVGICSGLAMSVKISGVYYPAAIGILLVILTAVTSRSVRDTFAAIFHGLFYLFVVPVAVFLLTWVPWFRNENSWGALAKEQGIAYWEFPEWMQPFLPDRLENWISYQADVMQFHTGLTTSSGQLHPWESKPWEWLYGGRPMLFLDLAHNGDTATKIWLLANFAVWWLIAPLVLYGVVRSILHRDIGWTLAVGGFLTGWVPWLIGYDRQMYFFYATALAPFVVLMVVFALRDGAALLEKKTSWSETKSQAAVVSTYLVFVLAFFAAYLPWYYGFPMSNDWHTSMELFDSWKPLTQ